MAFTYGQPPFSETGQAISIPRLEIPGGLTLTAVSGGSIDVAGVGAGDTVTSILVNGTEVLGATITYATSVAHTMRQIQRQINTYASNSIVWATNDGTSKILLWEKAPAGAAVTWTVATSETGFTATDVNFNTEQAYVAAVGWNAENEGADAFADTKVYHVGFDLSHLQSLNTNWSLTSAKGAELDLITEDQILRVYIGGKGAHKLGASAEKKTIGIWGVAQGHINMFIQSAAAQNPLYSLRLW